MLDTSAISEFFSGNADVKEHIERADELFLNPVILGELLNGFIIGNREVENRRLLREFQSFSLVGLVDIDEETSERYAVIVEALRESGTPIPTNDIWIAASAMQYGFSLLTCDDDYLKVPQVITELCQPS